MLLIISPSHMMVLHYIGTILGLFLNLGFVVAIYRRHIRRDMKVDMMWAKFIKDKELNGDSLKD